MKKKQPDFQKVKLRVGKSLPKGRNETRTSFQTRKINLREQIKKAPEGLNLTDFLHLTKSTDVKTKFDNLRKLRKYVLDKKDTLSMFFPDILKELGKALLESNPDIRSEAVTVLTLCAENLTDIQFKSFVVPLTSYLNCMMTHLSPTVRLDSLKLLDGFLSSHPSICESSEICFGLLNMISRKASLNPTVGKFGKIIGSRKLIDVMHSKKTGDQYRMNVLTRMLPILNGMLSEKKSTAMVNDDEKDIYWDAKEALYIPLYFNSGVKPPELDYSIYSLVNLEISDSKNFKILITDTICILSQILKGLVRTSTEAFSDSNESKKSVVKDLKIVVEILCCIGEWIIRNSESETDSNQIKNLKLICGQLLKGFPYSQPASKSTKSDKAECIHLNLGICYLYCMFALLTQSIENIELEKSVFSYLGDLLRVSGKMTEESILLTLKISKIVMQCEKFNESYKNGILVGLYGILQVHKISPVADHLYSFFMELSLDYDFTYLLDSEGMITWFKTLIQDLNFMVNSKIIKADFLKYIKQVCARRCTHFMEVLNSLPNEKFIEFLKFDDEKFQLTIIHLIVSLDKISAEFLQMLAETMREKSFSIKTATRLIRLLHSRFSKPDVSTVDQLEFVKLLLNLGFDSFLILDPSLDTDPLPCSGFLITFQQSFGCVCVIYPTYDFERHRELFEVCSECLSTYLQNEDHFKGVLLFITMIFKEGKKYPVHSVFAFIQFHKRYLVLDKHMPTAAFLQHFVFSCLLYNSWSTNDLPQEYWTSYCVPAVQECLDIADATRIILCLESNMEDFTEDQICHSLRILLFMYHKRLLQRVDEKLFFRFCDTLKGLDAFHKSPIFSVMLRNICDY